MHLSATGWRSPGIDVLRGLAVLGVVLHHIHLRFQLNKYPVADLVPRELGRVLFWSGYYSVIAFFVISGFLITTLALRRFGSLDRVPLLAFYRLRAARIMPCLILLLAVLSALHLFGFSDYTIKPERATLGRALLAALTFHFNWLEGIRGYLPGNWDVLWSLSVEEAFYVGFPIACLLVRREGLFLVLLAALIVIGPFNRVALEGRTPWEEYAYLSCMDGIAFGCCAAWISLRCKSNRTLALAAVAGGCAAIALIVVFRSTTVDLGLTRTGLNVTVLELGVALVLLAFSNGVGQRLLSTGTGAIRALGRCSYEIYLTHMFVVLGFMHPFKAWFGVTPSVYAFLFTYVAMLLASSALGYAVARLYSEPLNARLRGRPSRADSQPESPTQRPAPERLSDV